MFIYSSARDTSGICAIITLDLMNEGLRRFIALRIVVMCSSNKCVYHRMHMFTRPICVK